MGKAGVRYSDEFKAEAVSQVIDRGYSVLDVSKRIGVSDQEQQIQDGIDRIAELFPA